MEVKCEKSDRANTKTMKVLLVEDNQINIKVAKLLLTECGATEVVIANNGKKALALFSNQFDLVLLDIGLPDMTGVDVCAEIRKKVSGKKVPIIMCTADGNLEEKCKEVGADDYIVKPISLARIQSLIQRWCA